MSEIAVLSGMITSLNAASQIAKSFIGLRDTALIQDKVIELQGAILSAQTSALSAQAQQASLLQEKGNLEKEVAHLKAWEAEKQRYELKDLGEGCLAYVLKEAMANGEPPHEICANCYNQGFKTILQHEQRMPYRARVAFCQACGSELFLSGVRHAEHKSPKPSGRTR